MVYTSVMVKGKDKRPLYQRVAIDIAGFGLMLIAPFLGWLPGPGGIPIFIAGLGLVSLNHEWARRMLDDFEKKRDHFTDKYLMASPKVSFTIDLVSIVVLICGAVLAFTQEGVILRGVGLALISLTLFIVLSNQKRFERIYAWFKNHIN